MKKKILTITIPTLILILLIIIFSILSPKIKYTKHSVTLDSQNKTRSIECTFLAPHNMNVDVFRENIYLSLKDNEFDETEIWFSGYENSIMEFQNTNSTYSTVESFLETKEISNCFYIHTFSEGIRIAEFYIEDSNFNIKVRYYDAKYDETIIKMLKTFEIKILDE